MLVKAKNKPQDIVGMAVSQGTGHFVGSQLSGVEVLYAKTVVNIQSHDLQPDHGGRGSHTRNTVAGLTK